MRAFTDMTNFRADIVLKKRSYNTVKHTHVSRRAKRGGFLPDEALSLREMAAQADSTLLQTIISNPNHVLRNLCTLRPTIQYLIRRCPRPHPFDLPISRNRNFLVLCSLAHTNSVSICVSMLTFFYANIFLC